MLNLRSLLLLRSIGIGAQALVIALAIYGFNINLPRPPLLLILGLLAGWNLYSWLQSRNTPRNGEWYFFIQLFIDVLALSAILYFTGGATNPFTWLFLLPIVIAATTLPALQIWTLTLITIAAYSLLMHYYLPLDYVHPDHDSDFNQHILGMWFGFIFSAVTVAYFISGMAKNLRQRDRRLAEAREQQLRDERLVALGTLATGAAHELGTPLATMSIIIDELEDEYDTAHEPELNRQLGIIHEQIKRCKTALSTLSASSGESQAESGEAIRVQDYLLQIIEQWQAQRPGVEFTQHLRSDNKHVLILADQTLSQALINILNNAADASPDSVSFEAHWDSDKLEIQIKDRGEGFTPLASNRLGKEPYSSKQQGLGLGLFLAHATIKRMDGSITLFNREQGGVCTLIILPLEDLTGATRL